ncbi:uncharacterized protein K441DRAFT_318146 [Cenococcum geophilum 1.58]|uniref:uncharacterized protein n=1 Tax=Cenococcum geophilum 1.58 TaxID=794803 RepID=UPI00358E3987|nr:hypothetical protein K441DRAFT_318146 [Cenococcum geophilum 1.58]
MFSSNICPAFLYLGIWIFLFRDGLESLYSCCFDPAWLHKLPTSPQTGVETGTFRPHPSTQLLFVALFSPVGLARAPSHIDG